MQRYRAIGHPLVLVVLPLLLVVSERAAAQSPGRSGGFSSGAVTGPAKPVEAKALARGDAKEFRAHTQGIIDLALSPDGAKLATLTKGELTVWDLATMKGLTLRPTINVAAARKHAHFLAFTPDGTSLIAGTAQRAHIWELRDPDSPKTFGTANERTLEEGARFMGLIVSDDAKTVATLESTANAPLRITAWDTAAGKPRAELETPAGSNPRGMAAISPDGGLLAVVASQQNAQEVRLLEIAAGRERPPIQLGRIQPLGQLLFSQDGKLLFCRQSQGLMTWDVSGKQATLVEKKDLYIADPLWRSPDGKTLARPQAHPPSGAHQLELVDPRTLTRRSTVAGQDRVEFSADGQTIASLVGEESVAIVQFNGDRADLVTTVKVERDRGMAPDLRMALSADGKRLAAGTNSGSVWLWDLPTRAVVEAASFAIVRPTDNKEVDKIPLLGFSPDSRFLLSAFDTWTTLWDVQKKKLAFHLKDPDPKARNAKPNIMLEQVKSWGFHPDGRRLLVNGYGPSKLAGKSIFKLFSYELATGAGTKIRDDKIFYFAICMSPDGKTLAARAGENVVLLDSNFKERILLPKVAGPDKPGKYEQLAFSPDGQFLVACEDIKGSVLVKVWEVKTAQERPTVAQAKGATAPVFVTKNTFVMAPVPGLALLPRAMADLYNVETGASERSLDLQPPHPSHATTAAFALDVPYFASAGRDGEVFVRDLATGEVKTRLSGHKGPVVASALSRDGKWLATAGIDRTIKLWELPP